MPHSVKCLGRIPRTMRNFLRGYISDGALKYGGDNLSLYQRGPLYDLEAQRVSVWPIAPGGPNDNISIWALARFDVMAPFEEQEMEVLLRVYQKAGWRHHRLVFRWRISYGKPVGDDLLSVWPEAKNTLNKFLQHSKTNTTNFRAGAYHNTTTPKPPFANHEAVKHTTPISETNHNPQPNKPHQHHPHQHPHNPDSSTQPPHNIHPLFPM